MSSRVWHWMVIFALGGLVAAGVSTYVHLQLLQDPTYTTFCDVSDSVSCAEVYLSRFGSVRGVPVALGGVLWFLGVLLLAFASARAPAESQPGVAGYLLAWSTGGLAVAVYMAYASFVVLQTFCLLCGVVYVAVIGIFILSGTGPFVAMARLPSAVIGDIACLVRSPVGLGLTIAFVTGATAAVVWFPTQATGTAMPTTESVAIETADERSAFDRFWEEQPRINLAIPRGDEAVLVVKFNDYQCPACADSFRRYKPIFAKYASSHPGAVRLVTLDYPLDPECNEESPNGPHDAACEAAVAARLAKKIGGVEGERMARWLYANQETMSRETIASAARNIAGIDADAFDGQYDATVARVKADIALGASVPVEATPTFVINGVTIKGRLAPQYFDRAIASELERAEGSS